MIDKESTDYFYEQIKLFETAEINKQTISNIYKIYKEAIDLILKNSKVEFSSYYSKLNHIINNYSVPDELAVDFLKLNAYLKKFKNQIVSKTNIQKSLKILITFINFFSNSPIPYYFNLNNFSDALSLVKEEISYQKNRINVFDAVFIKKKYDSIICKIDNEEVTIKLDLKYWQKTFQILWENCSINLINILTEVDHSHSYFADINSAIVIEPNYLIDVTDLSSCYNHNNPIPILYFTKKFKKVISNIEIMIGNFVNNIFDELITDSNKNIEDIIDKSFRQKYLQVFSLVLKNKEIIKEIKYHLQNHIENLQKAINRIEFDSVSIEPTFISTKFGLQGRLDALLKFKDNKNKMNIIELKSGSFPNVKTSLSFNDNQNFYLNIWTNHLIQANCYDLLINSTFENRTGTTSILYSKDNEAPLRDATSTPFTFVSIINTRNQIIYLDKLIREKKFNTFYQILKKSKDLAQNFVSLELENIINTIQNSNKITNYYFFEYFSLIQKEIYKTKIGDSFHKGFSSLWLDSYDEKLDNFSVLTNLILDHTGSDFDNYHLNFISSQDISNFNSLRKGDQVILYPMNDIKLEVYKNQILKATIKDINHKQIIISLRNKNPDYQYLTENKYWIIELDLSESLTNKLISSIFQIYNLPETKKKLLFGQLKPEFNTIETKKYPYLNETQNIAVNKALSAKNYFLIQGPPGTGKTSFVIKTIIEEIYNNKDDKILVLAYTNRAVDEIISALKTISDSIKLIRFGSKESSQHQDVLLSNLAENTDLNKLYLKLKQTRIFAATIASVLYNPEILTIVKFNIAIIDEASQILEPYLINIINEIDKFILIGDEKQLPAIINLDGKDTEVENAKLKDIGISDFKISFFERLLNLCKKNNWNDAFILLNFQARMHVEIQDFPNKHFYESKLMTMNKEQKSNSSNYLLNCKDEFLSSILKYRILFINSFKESHSKLNISEVEFIKIFINNFFEEFHEINEKIIGVISPFRAQCSEIMKNFTEEQKKFIICDTVERFQGSERDIIIISMASNFEYLINSIQSLTEINGYLIDRKLNVAMTRAKEHLIILGNSEILKSAPSYNELINHLQQQNKFFELDDLIKLVKSN